MLAAMRLLWVRHGQMEFSGQMDTRLETINALFNGEHEAGLSARGRAEAAAVADHLARSPVDAVYSSELLRARETAATTGQRLSLPVEVREDLTELRPGRLEEDALGARFVRAANSLPFLSLRLRKALTGATLIPLYFLSWLSGRTVGGEKRDDLEARIHRTFDWLRFHHPPHARIALFAHGYLIFYLSGWLAGPGARQTAFRRAHVPNGSITELELGPSGPPTLLTYAETHHL
ncbi:MAG: histidine phosphatase family protein [bacterium]